MEVCETCNGKGKLPDKYIPRDHSNRAFIWDHAHDGYTTPGPICRKCNGSGKGGISGIINCIPDSTFKAVIKIIGSSKPLISPTLIQCKEKSRDFRSINFNQNLIMR